MFTIPIVPPFSFERLLYRLQSHPDPQMLVLPEEKKVIRGFRVLEEIVVATMIFSGELESPSLHIDVSRSLTPTQEKELIRQISHMFSTEVDLEPIYQVMMKEPALRPLVQHFRGLRYLLDPEIFPSMVRTIIGQQINLAFAASLTERLIQLCGDMEYTLNGEALHIFPTAQAVAKLDIAELRELQFSQRKAEYIIDFAKAVVENKIELERLWDMEDEEVIQYLVPLRGIGRWTVECLLMFGLGRMDLLPAADIGIRNGIALVYDLPDKPDEKSIRLIGENWMPYRSYVSLYIWEAVGAARRKELFH